MLINMLIESTDVLIVKSTDLCRVILQKNHTAKRARFAAGEASVAEGGHSKRLRYGAFALTIN